MDCSPILLVFTIDILRITSLGCSAGPEALTFESILVSRIRNLLRKEDPRKEMVTPPVISTDVFKEERETLLFSHEGTGRLQCPWYTVGDRLFYLSSLYTVVTRETPEEEKVNVLLVVTGPSQTAPGSNSFFGGLWNHL